MAVERRRVGFLQFLGQWLRSVGGLHLRVADVSLSLADLPLSPFLSSRRLSRSLARSHIVDIDFDPENRR